MSMLYIVGTPIGNLEDISLRALRILGEVDFILCEDTRVTKKLLEKYAISAKTISYHQHSNVKKEEYILDLLGKGHDMALVSDAGTPGISDPGGKLIDLVLKRMGAKVRIESVPGPSAVTAALSISGIPTDKFIFFGFPPHKKGRQKFLDKIIRSPYPAVVYESKHRIIKLLKELEEKNREIIEKNRELKDKKEKGILAKEDEPLRISPITSVVICREISKMHETVYRGDIKAILERIKNSQEDQKGEFAVVIGK